MGASASRPTLEIEGAFKTSVLLVHAPEQLFGTVLTAGPWCVLRSIHCDVVRWDGESLVAEKYRQTVGEHHAVVYFIDPCDSTPDAIAHRMSAVLAPIANATSHVGTPLYVCSYGFRTEDAEQETRGQARIKYTNVFKQVFPPAEPTKAGRAAAEELRRRVRYSHIGTVTDWNRVAVNVAWGIVPKKVARPLTNLARDFAESCGASDVVLVDSHSFLPVVAHVSTATLGVGVPPEERALQLVEPLRGMMTSLQGEDSQQLDSLRVSGAFGLISVSWVVHPWCMCIVVVPDVEGTAPATGGALVDINLKHYATHFSNVIRNTTEKNNFTAILPP